MAAGEKLKALRSVMREVFVVTPSSREAYEAYRMNDPYITQCLEGLEYIKQNFQVIPSDTFVYETLPHRHHARVEGSGDWYHTCNTDCGREVLCRRWSQVVELAFCLAPLSKWSDAY